MSAATASDLRLVETVHTDPLTGKERPAFDVWANDRYLGRVIEREHRVIDVDGLSWRMPWCHAKPAGWPYFYPTADGLRATAIRDLLCATDRPSGYQRRVKVPERLVIAALRTEQGDER